VTAALPLDRYLDDLRRAIGAALEAVLGDTGAPPVIAEPLRYSLLGPGKRLRPCLTLAAADSLAPRAQLSPEEARALAMPAACAVEMIHTYSLIHDDLPAMDDDSLRRGRATTHVVYGEGIAILAGDGLLTDAFRVLARGAGHEAAISAPADRRLQAISRLAEAAGVAGMVGGQAIDLAVAGQARAAAAPLNRAGLEDMHLRKTGALIRAAAVIGAIMVGATEDVITGIDDYARDLGLAFQIIDDVLDVEGSTATLGKTAGKDAASGKSTFPAVLGLAESKAYAAECVARARASLRRIALTGPLDQLAEWSLVRRA
jgi:geranylgeranyl diphosphate synthase type II